MNDDNTGDDIYRSLQKVQAQNIQIVDMVNTHVKQSDSLRNDMFSLAGRFVAIDTLNYKFAVDIEMLHSSLNLLFEFIKEKNPEFEEFVQRKMQAEQPSVPKTRTRKKKLDK